MWCTYRLCLGDGELACTAVQLCRGRLVCMQRGSASAHQLRSPARMHVHVGTAGLQLMGGL
jgi:hypothetical protein